MSRQWMCVACALAVCVPLCVTAGIKQPIKKPTYDPALPTIELFEGIDAGTIEATVIPKSAHESNLFLTNKSGSPVSVKLPPAVVAVQVLKQGFGQNPGGNGFFNGNNAQNGKTQTGQGQPVGGGPNATGAGNGNNNPFNVPGANFFSVPSEKTVQIPLKTVCLAHERPDPRPKMTYRLVRVEEFSSDPVLHELLKQLASDDVETATAQAAAWHLTDRMSWKELEDKKINHAGGLPDTPYFSKKQIKAAKDFFEKAQEKVKENSPRKL